MILANLIAFSDLLLTYFWLFLNQIYTQKMKVHYDWTIQKARGTENESHIELIKNVGAMAVLIE